MRQEFRILLVEDGFEFGSLKLLINSQSTGAKTQLVPIIPVRRESVWVDPRP